MSSILNKGRAGFNLSSFTVHKHKDFSIISPEPSVKELAINTGCRTGKSVSAELVALDGWMDSAPSAYKC